MSEAIDFDALSRLAHVPDPAIEDQNLLYACLFALPKWHFLARGQFPDVHPYIASNEAVADGRQMVRAFTDTDRLWRFAEENGLVEAEGHEQGNVLILSLQTATIVGFLEQFLDQGVYGVWFNSDSVSDGFFAPLAQLRPIREHLERSGLLPGE